MASFEASAVHVDIDAESGSGCAFVRVRGAPRGDVDWRTPVEAHCGTVFAFVVQHRRGGATIVPEESLPNAHIEPVEDGTYTYRLATPGSVPMAAATADLAVQFAFDAIRAWGHQRIVWILDALGESPPTLPRIDRIRAALAAIPGHSITAVEERDGVVIVDDDGVLSVRHPDRLDIAMGYAGDLEGVEYAMAQSGMVGWSIDGDGVVHPHPQYRKPS